MDGNVTTLTGLDVDALKRKGDPTGEAARRAEEGLGQAGTATVHDLAYGTKLCRSTSAPR